MPGVLIILKHLCYASDPISKAPKNSLTAHPSPSICSGLLTSLQQKPVVVTAPAPSDMRLRLLLIRTVREGICCVCRCDCKRETEMQRGYGTVLLVLGGLCGSSLLSRRCCLPPKGVQISTGRGWRCSMFLVLLSNPVKRSKTAVNRSRISCVARA